MKHPLYSFFFSIGHRITAILGGILVLFIVFTFIQQYILSAYAYSYSTQVTLFEMVQQLKTDIQYGNTTINNYFKTGDRSKLAQYNDVYKETSGLIERLYSDVPGDDLTYLIRSISTAYKNYFSECCGASFLFNSGNYEYYSRIYAAEKIQAYIQTYCDNLLDMLLEQSVESNRTIKHNQFMIIIYNWIFIIIVIGAFVIFLFYVSKNLTKPLGKLIVFSHAVAKGDFTERIPVYKTTNSVGVLIHAYNTMAADLQRMITSLKEKVTTEQKLLQEQRKNLEYQELLNQATFLALQTQTNPHFLFNTLNSISRTITLGKTEQSVEMIDSLSKLLRYSLSDATVPVPLSSELEIIDEYMYIQHLRFGNRVSCKTIIEPHIASRIKLPKFTIQPLVENAIIHGLEPKPEGGKIIISAKQKGTRGIIRIFDNGIGISAPVLRQLQSDSYTSKSGRLGVYNTKRRLELQEKSGHSVFSIISKENHWTMIILRITII